jgi:acyl-CoA thioesterase
LTASEFWAGITSRAAGDGWVGAVDPSWNIGNNPNGGYTLAIAARAMLEASGRPDPLTVTAHYVAVPQMGEVRIRVQTVRAGRRYATLSADMTQGDKDLVRVIGAFGDLDAMAGPTRVAGAPPALPPPERCLDLLKMSEAAGMALPEVVRRYEVRLDPDSQWVRARRDRLNPLLRVGGAAEGEATAPAGADSVVRAGGAGGGQSSAPADVDSLVDGGAGGGQSSAPAGVDSRVAGGAGGDQSSAPGPAGLLRAGTAATEPPGPEVVDPLEVAGWIRFADGTEPSVLGLLAMADAFPPTMLGYQDVRWIPTIEFTVHVRGRPAPGWIAGTIRTRFLVDGLLEEDGELWDSEGRLVALSRQMALVLPGR